jgi:3D (Asp-Asp-Asp) domain-containing protein
MQKVASLLCALSLAAMSLAAAHAADHKALLAKIDTDLFDLPPPATLPAPVRLWATYYHVHAVDAIPDGYALLDPAGASISPKIPGRDWCQAALQGVIAIKGTDGLRRTYTYESSVHTEELACNQYYKKAPPWSRAAGRSRFGVAKGPFGDGAGGFQVVPYRSIAVDTKVLPLGTVVYVPAARGVEVTMPSGRKAKHDGYFFASDRGGAISGNHIDVFAGHWAENPFPSFIFSTAQKTFEAYVIADEKVKPRLHNLHAFD